MIFHGVIPRGLTEPPPLGQQPSNIGRFGRMFPVHDPFVFDPEMLSKLADLMHAQESDDNPILAAGYTFLGQFIDHDITFDDTSSLEQQNDPHAFQNFRTPMLELDSLYGRGPLYDRCLYQKNDVALFIIGADGANEEGIVNGEDLPRNSEGTAIIPDAREDENLVISQLHLVFMKFHNAVVARLRDDDVKFPGTALEIFDEAQRIVRWHYQWIVVNEFLPRIMGSATASAIFSPSGKVNFKLFTECINQFGERFMPVEFSVAAYRYGHSEIRSNYTVNDEFANIRVLAQVPSVEDESSLSIEDISKKTKGKLDAGWNVGWGHFFEMEDDTPAPGKPVFQSLQAPQISLKIDTQVTEPLSELPEFKKLQPSSDVNHDPRLAFRDLMRGRSFSLPYGQWIARKLSLPDDKILTLSHNKIEAEPLAETGLPHDKWPLWFYILKEAEVLAEGLHLGPVGAQIVGETFGSLLTGDLKSYLAQNPTWSPWTNQPFTILDSSIQRFTMPDLIRFALNSGLGKDEVDVRTTSVGGHKGP